MHLLSDRYESYDLKTDAGAVKHLVSGEKSEVRDWILENIDIAKRLHHITTIVLINHYDCGAYGGNSSFESDDRQFSYHSDQLSRAKRFLSEKHPDLKIETLFALLVDNKVKLLEV